MVAFRRRSADIPPELVEEVQRLARPLATAEDLDPLLNRIGESRFVLLGEATHGTSEFYRWRQLLSERLIAEKGFSFIAVEGDWPDCFRVNRYVKGIEGTSARDVLHQFERWPTWMWANHEIVQLAEWLHQHNRSLPEEQNVGFYGLDVYSLWESMHAILEYLQEHDGRAAIAAKRAFACFEPYREDAVEYARATRWVPDTCEDEVVRLLTEMSRHLPSTKPDWREESFAAGQNALVAKNAELYYRTMVGGGPESWNIRDRHMVETLDRLMDHHGPGAKAIVWEHNTHIGDARFTDMLERGEVNVGQLVREEYGESDVVLVGFATHRGTVIAGDSWDAPMEVMDVPPGGPNTWEDALHRASDDDKLLLLRDADPRGPMQERRGHRAIGVVYDPHYEQFGNYVPTVLPRRYDALLYIDETHALRPLHMPAGVREELPETFPYGV